MSMESKVIQKLTGVYKINKDPDVLLIEALQSQKGRLAEY